MTSAPLMQTNSNLLVAALSAITGTNIVSISDKSENKMPLVSRRMYLYGPVGDTDIFETSSTKYEIYAKTLTGKLITCIVDSNATFYDLKSCIEEKEGIPPLSQRLVFAGRELKHDIDDITLSRYGICDKSTLHLVLSLRRDDPVILNAATLDPQYDHDFTNIKEDKKSYTRGSQKYSRPYGWQRIAIKVSDKFENMTWLGNTDGPGEWPVSYHGTDVRDTRTMAQDGFNLTKGKRFKFVCGVYTTPDIHVAEKYAKRFDYKNEQYLVVLQNRVNPESLIKISADQTGIEEYWINLDEEHVRPYGICIRKL